jgi:preprotein translocase subunit SecE
MSTSEASQQANRAEMDPKRLAVVAYLVLGLVTALFLGHILELVFAQLGISNARILEGLDFRVGEIASAVVTIGAGVGCWFNPRVRSISVETASELMRVTWPSWDETRVSTIAVIVASLIAGVLLFGIDSLAYRFMVDWLPHLWGKL